MKWTGERYKCRKCGEIYPFSLTTCNCGGICDKIADRSSAKSYAGADEPRFPDFSHYPELEQERDFIQHVADLLNQSPKRKVSMGFATAWMLGIKGFFGVDAALIGIVLPIGILIDPPKAGLDAIGYFILLCLFILGLVGLYLLYISFKTLLLIKNGYFTTSIRPKSGIFMYKDESGIAHQWNSTWYTRLLQQPCLDCNDCILNLAVVDRQNPNRVLIVDFAVYRETNSDLSFYIPAWFIAIWLPVKYNLLNQKFTTISNYFWKLLAIIVGFIAFCSILDYFNL